MDELELMSYAKEFFNKIRIEIFYPDFDAGYNNIARIQYEAIYPDLKGNLIQRAKCWMDSSDSNENYLQLAAWTPASKYEYMGFEFMKADRADTNLIVSRTIYYTPESQALSQLSTLKVNTGSDDVRNFKIIDKSTTASLHNKVAITIGVLGSAVKSTNAFETLF